MHCRRLPLALLTAGLSLLAPDRGAAAPAIAGAPETVFSWVRDSCAAGDFPETPARAWRDAAGATHLVSGSEASRAMVGPDLDHVVRDCSVLFQGSGDADPAAVDDRAWIHSVYTADGVHLVALVHQEYHDGADAVCGAEMRAACWRNAVIEITSDDGGRTFRRQGVALVAGSPYPRDPDETARTGYFNPSNIIARDGYLYVYVWAPAFRAQRRGACLLRRPIDGSAADWRAWDGVGFGVRFADPYREDVADPAAHVCAPLPGVTTMISSVAEGPDGRLLAVSPAARADDAGRVPGIYWMESSDMLTWSTPDLLLPVSLLWRHGCDEAKVYAYPSLLDPASPSPTYTAIGRRPWLYLVEVPLVECRAGADRNLVRFPLSWPAP